ncbi:TIM barrel protein [Streptomyces spongiae]|uniref:Sugar phosphate isomerase/epimerase n=1 Tax=Streptomyces spongiae TaxID=565072 RepID=A0A5N8XI93_9ACTN|nr:TIM barrel protein [Streptomyces spongiae]MPY58796.1 sugar phosphate isomerase/epimerase [Streptomyces spongiae]
MNPPFAPFAFGCRTSVFTHHRLHDVLTILADLGYDGLALSLDHNHLDPFASDLPQRVDSIVQRLRWHDLSLVVEADAPFLLDPWDRHQPTMMDAGALAKSRIEMLLQSVHLAADLGAETVKLVSGPTPAGLSEAEAWHRLTRGIEAVLALAERYGISLALEPAPGMSVDTLGRFLELVERVDHHQCLGLALDFGNPSVWEGKELAAYLDGIASRLVHVQMAGSDDDNSVLAALRDIEYRGLVCADLSAGSLDAPQAAHRALEQMCIAVMDLPPAAVVDEEPLRTGPVAESNGLSAPLSVASLLSMGLEPSAQAWLNEAVVRVAMDPGVIVELFSEAGSRCGQARLNGLWTAGEAARVLLLSTLPLGGEELAASVGDLYRQGGQPEQRAVLRALDVLDSEERRLSGHGLGECALPLIHEALRSDDMALVEAAIGEYAANHLPAEEYSQAVLACVQHEITPDGVSKFCEAARYEIPGDRDAARRVPLAPQHLSWSARSTVATLLQHLFDQDRSATEDGPSSTPGGSEPSQAR